MSRQDRQGARTVSEFEQRYQIGKTFSEIMGVANGARDLALETKRMYEGLGHKEIFDLLTNNGEWQGLYKEGGNVYINASYIKAGELSADLLKTGIIKSKNYTEAAGLVAQGTSIDLDKGIINSAKFKVDEFGKMKATGGYIGGFDIAEGNISKTIMTPNATGAYTDTITLSPTELTARRVDRAEGLYTTTMETRLVADGINIKYAYVPDDGTTPPLEGRLMSYEEQGRVFDLYIDFDTNTVKVRER